MPQVVSPYRNILECNTRHTLAVHTTLAMLMATIGLTVGLAVRTTLTMLMATIGLTVGPMTLAALTLLMTTIGLTVGLATLMVLDPIGVNGRF